VPHGTDRIPEGRRRASLLLARSPQEEHLVLRGAHPDLIELSAPEGKEKIGIAQVREVIHQAQFAPTQARQEVCLLPRAEQLTMEAANALLKVLEEPPRGLVFLFLAENPGDLLATIVSRSQVIHMVPSVDSDSLSSIPFTISRSRSLSAASTCLRNHAKLSTLSLTIASSLAFCRQVSADLRRLLVSHS